MKVLKTPAQWEAEEGIRVSNRSVYSETGLEVPIDYETWANTVSTLTVMRNWNTVPKTFGKQTAVERIETKIAEYQESLISNGDDAEAVNNDAFIILGLSLAKTIIEDL